MEVKLCKTCNGDGTNTYDIGTHYSDYKTETCSHCGGTGRILKGSYSYEVPFNFDKSKIYKIDSKIVDLIRNLEKRS